MLKAIKGWFETQQARLDNALLYAKWKNQCTAMGVEQISPEGREIYMRLIREDADKKYGYGNKKGD